MPVTIHPYKGYINTKFNIYARGTEQNYSVYKKDDPDGLPISSGKIYPNIPNNFCLSAPGNYSVKFEGGETVDIYVEDGYKFGGSGYKKSFIFDDCPWCFIVMHDRTYFYNIDTKRSYVEPISPDKIIKISSKYALFENDGQKECTVFALDEEIPFLCISDIITYNDNIIIWQEHTDDKKELCLLSLQSDTNTVEKFSFDDYVLNTENDQLIYYYKNDVWKISLTEYNGAINYNIKGTGSIVSIVSPNLVVYYQEYISCNKLFIHNIDTGELIKTIELDGFLAEINGKQLININDRQESLENTSFSLLGIPELTASAIYHRIFIYTCESNVFYTINTKKLFKKGPCRIIKTEESFLYSINSDEGRLIQNVNGKLISYGNSICYFNSCESIVIGNKYGGSGYTEGGRIFIENYRLYMYKDNTLYTLSHNGYWDKPRKIELDFSEFEKFNVVIEKDTQNITTLYGKNLGKKIGKYNENEPFIKTDEYYIFSNGRMIKNKDIDIIPMSLSNSLSKGLRITKEGVSLYILENGHYDKTSIMEDTYDVTTFRNVLLSEDGKYIMHREDKQALVMNIENGSVQNFDNMSYIQHINGIRPLFETPSSLQPILINPITGQRLDCNNMPAYHFVSPNGKLYADTKLREYVEYYNKETNVLISKEEYSELLQKFSFPWKEEKDSIIWNEILENRKQFVLENFEYLNKQYPRVFKNDKTGKAWIDTISDYAADFLISHLISERGIAIIRNTSDDSIYTKIKLGTPLMYINYVSFSQDSKYVAIAGYRNSGGLFIIYDLESKKEIAHEDTRRAVWNVAFSAKNAIAAYTSSPNTFFAACEDEYSYEKFEDRLIYGNNFLTFSPDGKYFALSQQGYISKYDMDGNIRDNWGHQPSSLVEIHSTKNYKDVICVFYDLSDKGIYGNALRDTVASVSFSNDNNRIMMVGYDGVVIIRNLDFTNYASK